MKTLKNVLAGLAFIIAFGAAFATAAFETQPSKNDAFLVKIPNRLTNCSTTVTCVIDGGASCDTYLYHNGSNCEAGDNGYEEQ